MHAPAEDDLADHDASQKLGLGGMATMHVVPSFHAYARPAPADVVTVPSMMSEIERGFLYWYALEGYKGDGVIVDAGLFLGASTLCFGKALLGRGDQAAIRKRYGKPIKAYERGIVTPLMPSLFANYKMPGAPAVGESFAPILEANIAPVADAVELQLGDVCEARVPQDAIEILFLDVVKSPKIAEHIAVNYFTKLIPQKSIVIQQDYLYDSQHYLKVMQEYFAKYFEYVGEIGPSAIFRCVEPIPTEVAEGFVHRKPSIDEQIALSTAAMFRSVYTDRRYLMALSHLRLLLQLRGYPAAKEYFQALRWMFPQQTGKDAAARIRRANREAQRIMERREAVRATRAAKRAASKT